MKTGQAFSNPWPSALSPIKSRGRLSFVKSRNQAFSLPDKFKSDRPCSAHSRLSRPTVAWPDRLVQHCLSQASTAQSASPSGCCFLPFNGLVSFLSAFLSTSGFLFARGFCLLHPLSFCFCPDAACLCFKALQRRDLMSSVGLHPV